MADEPRRSVRATKGQHTKSLDLLDSTTEPSKKRGSKKAATKKATSQEASGAEEEEIIRCICGDTEQDDESDEDWIMCDSCQAWQHNICMGVTTDSDKLETMVYFCEQCKPEDHKELLDAIARGERPWDDRRRAHEAELKAQKAKKGKKGKAKVVSNATTTTTAKTGAAQNGKAATPAKSVTPGKGATPDAAAELKKEPIIRAGSTKRKGREEPADEQAKSKVRKISSTPQEDSVPSDLASTIEELDNKNRIGAAKLIHKGLLFSMKGAQKNGLFKGTDADLEKKVTRLTLEIERGIYDTSASLQAHGAQARKVSANLKGNPELCERLLQKTLTPRTLAVMTDDDMASKELQKKTADMKARSDKQSIMLSEDGPRIRRTHKGDEIIESESFASPTEDRPAARRRSMLDPNGDMATRSRDGSPADGGELPMDIDEYRSRDDIRGNAAPSETPIVESRPSPPKVRKVSTQVNNFDINNVFSKVQSPTVLQHTRKPSGQAPPKNGPGEDADIDRMLEDGDDEPEYEPAEFDADPSVIWRGSLVMNTVTASFPAVARHIGGAELQLAWSDLLPENLAVAGRIDSEKATEYLCGLRYSTPTDIVVLALTPAGETASEHFKVLFEYFHSKNRFGVVGNKGFANVRDTYLVPILAGSGNIPEFLLNLENNKLPEYRPEPMILVTLVIRNEIPIAAEGTRAFDGTNSPSTLVTHHQRQMSISGGGPAMSPVAPQGSFAPPATPSAPPPQAPPALQTEAEKRQRMEAQQRGEALAAEILGPFITAPTVSFLLPQAWVMKPEEWTVVKEIFESHPDRATTDLKYLSDLLEAREAPKRST